MLCALIASTDALARKPPPADLLLRNGRIYTVNPTEPVVEAVAVRDGRVIATGTTEELKDLEGKKTTVMDLRGQHAVYPGFKDSHAHLLSLGLSKLNVDLTGTTPEPTLEMKRRAWVLAFVECLRAGVTSVDEAGLNYDDVMLIKQLAQAGQVPIRLYVMLDGWQTLQRFDRPEIGSESGFLTIRAVKLSADGTLDSRGAALLEPYQDDPAHSGLIVTPVEELKKAIGYALDHGFQVATHAIGDRANRLILDLYEQALAHDMGGRDHRWRIEHAQVIDSRDISRFGTLGVIASMQTAHATSDRPWAVDRIGNARIKEGAYAWRKLLDSGAHIANGTDAPVENISAIRNFYAAVTRMDEKGQPPGGFDPEEKMTREEALRSYTIEGAYATFTEKEAGSIEVGKNADFVILSKDIMQVPEPEILKTKVEYVIVGGRIYNAMK